MVAVCRYDLCDHGIFISQVKDARKAFQACKAKACQGRGFKDLGWCCQTKKQAGRNHIYARTKQLNACAQEICKQNAVQGSVDHWRFLPHLRNQDLGYTLCPASYVPPPRKKTVMKGLLACHQKAGCLIRPGLFGDRRLSKLLDR
jgi:hypothetical protein